VALPRKMVEGSLRHRETSEIIAHNHPGGPLESSESDDRLTEAVRKALEIVDISLQEHGIISRMDILVIEKTAF